MLNTIISILLSCTWVWRKQKEPFSLSHSRDLALAPVFSKLVFIRKSANGVSKRSVNAPVALHF